ncbi:MAG: aminotransferase class I/II-fold pyridoxal phosphate-dependent enzyme [Acidobacteriota bacterium]|nr:aminotransferase class I/II-fold pyridoxal phosphate-dependent enzyme [Acidobacteriota bacterium]
MPATISVADAAARFEAFQRLGLNLDMTRGKPCAEQLDLSGELLSAPGAAGRANDGSDTRNYGGLEGLSEARRLLADLLSVDAAAVVVGDNASLSLMYDTFSEAMHRGVPGGEGPWPRATRVLCPVPGYDRHFGLAAHLGCELVSVEMTTEGPDLDQVRALVADDPAVKAIFCVPRYSNPTGVTYSDEIVEGLANMPTAATDFRIVWDNAYAVHHLYDDEVPLADILAACRAAGVADRVLAFGSTSKVTLPGSGICALAASPANREWFLANRAMRTIGPDKINQLRHAQLLPDAGAVRAHMRRHAEIIRPKFEAVDAILDAELGGLGIATWSRPRGGYFIDLDTRDGCARDVVALAGRCGVKLTPAGATFPYGQDPRDRNIRVAPTFPPMDELRQAAEILALAIVLIAAERDLLESL